MHGERIKLARKRAGLSLRALAEKMGGKVSAQAIGKYERGEMTPSSPVLIALSKALGVSISYLMAPLGVELGEVEFRSKANISARDRAKVETEVLEEVERYLQVERLLELESAVWSCPRNMPRRIGSPEEAEDLSTELREAWKLGNDPIPSMTELLEEKGIKVLLISLPEKVSGFTCTVKRPDGQDAVPVIVVNENVGLERRRLTLAHELAHRVITASKQRSRDLERWCNRFAGAFLVPREHLEREMGDHRSAVGYRELLDLKRLYGVAASAMLVRLEQIGILSRDALEYAFRTFARGWRSSEPEPLNGKAEELERPRRFERLVYRALAEDMIVATKAAELLRKPLVEVEEGLRGPARAHHR